MTKNPFKVLGVTDSVSQTELYDAYSRLREEWIDKRFEPGEVGKEACDRLEELDEAYKDCLEILEDRYYIDNSEEVLDKIEALIRDKKYDAAQDELNKLNRRSARWHYLQGGIYYQKSWHNDARRELQMAVDMEPGNQKYQDTLKGIEEAMKGKSETFHNNYYAKVNNSDGKVNYQTTSSYRGRDNDICDCCSTLICADCCCECMGGDLIACC